MQMRIFDRRTGKRLGVLSEQECKQLMVLFEEPTRDEEPSLIDPDLLERFAESGASEQLITVVQQILQGREDFDLDFEPDSN